MCSLFSLSDHRLCVEVWSKLAPQPSFQASVKSWILWSLEWRSEPFIMFVGFCHNSRCAEMASVQGRRLSSDWRYLQCSLRWNWKGLMWRRPSGTIFSVDASNPISDIKQKSGRIKSWFWAISLEWGLQWLNLDGIRSQWTKTPELVLVRISPDLWSTPRTRLGQPKPACSLGLLPETGICAASRPGIGEVWVPSWGPLASLPLQSL